MPSEATINRVLAVRGLRELVPARRPRSSWTRFEREKVNSLWQMDGFDVTLADGQQVVVIHVSDDCSRKDLALHVAPSESAAAAWEAFVKASAEHGLPMELLTDNSRGSPSVNTTPSNPPSWSRSAPSSPSTSATSSPPSSPSTPTAATSSRGPNCHRCPDTPLLPMS